MEPTIDPQSLTNVDEPPTFIIGSGRCGTTLVQSIINSHPSFAVWGEHNGFVRHISDAYFKTRESIMARSLNADGPSAIRLAQLRDVSHWSAWDNLLDASEMRQRFRDFISAVFCPSSVPHCRWGFKEIRYGRDDDDYTLYFLLECFPTARFVIMVRNPADTAFSMMSSWHRDLGLNVRLIDCELVKLAHWWSTLYRNLASFSRVVGSQCHIIRFEDLLTSTEATVRDLWLFLGVTDPPELTAMLVAPKNRAPRTDRFANAIRARIDRSSSDLARITYEARRLYDYVDWQRVST